MSNGKKVFVVDYDLPSKNACTQRFYKEIKGILSENGIAAKSTKSVFTLESEKTARAICDLANKCGSGNLYKAEKVDT